MKPRSLVTIRRAAVLASAVVCGIAGVAMHAVAQQDQNNNAQVHILPVRGNVFMLVGAGGNIALWSRISTDAYFSNLRVGK